VNFSPPITFASRVVFVLAYARDSAVERGACPGAGRLEMPSCCRFVGDSRQPSARPMRVCNTGKTCLADDRACLRTRPTVQRRRVRYIGALARNAVRKRATWLRIGAKQTVQHPEPRRHNRSGGGTR